MTTLYREQSIAKYLMHENCFPIKHFQNLRCFWYWYSDIHIYKYICTYTHNKIVQTVSRSGKSNTSFLTSVKRYREMRVENKHMTIIQAQIYTGLADISNVNTSKHQLINDKCLLIFFVILGLWANKQVKEMHRTSRYWASKGQEVMVTGVL